MSRVLLITSGAFTGTELQVEFGRLPPAFLPIGNRRLFVHQHAAFAQGMSRVILSLPEEYTPNAFDLDLLRQLGIEVVAVPPGLSLGQSVVYVINVTAVAGGQLAILHGDTLLRGIDTSVPDAVSVGTPPHSYDWGHIHVADGHLLPTPPPDAASDLILSGYFNVADTVLLVQAITRRGGSFVAGIQDYAAQRPLRALGASEWLDFGHANTYHQSRGRVTTERAFNDLQTTPRTVVKSGAKPDKIRAEAHWFEALPAALRAHTPAYLGPRDSAGGAGYALEYLYLPTLSDLFVFGRLPLPAWDRIFDACDEFLTACAAHPAAPAAAAARTLYGEKTQQRLEEFAALTGTSIDAPCRLAGRPLPSLRRMAEDAAAMIPAATAAHSRLVHGDFCFSNILYDARASLVRVIDPRGIDTAGTHTCFGDVRYDLAKLYHSVAGRYDHIVAGYCRVTGSAPLDLALELPADPTLGRIEQAFLARGFAGLSHGAAASHAICVLLFLSMLPLHHDDPARQRALLANAMRLYAAAETRAVPA